MMRFGALEFYPVGEHVDLVAPPVDALLKTVDTTGVEVAAIDAQLSDTTAFCEEYEIRPETAANCVVLKAKRGDKEWFAACVILANTRADVNGVARRFLDARRVSFAPMEEAVKETGMEYGAITPVGLPAGWPILVDSRVAASDVVIIGSGVRGSKLLVPGSFLSTLPNSSVVEELAREVAREAAN